MAAIRELDPRIPQLSLEKPKEKSPYKSIHCGRCDELTERTAPGQKYCKPCGVENEKTKEREYGKIRRARFKIDQKFRERVRESNTRSYQRGREQQNEPADRHLQARTLMNNGEVSKSQRESRPSKARERQVKRLEREIKIAAEKRKTRSNPKIRGFEPLFTVGETGIPVYFSFKEKPHFSFRYGGAEFRFDTRSAVENYGGIPCLELRKITHPVTRPDRLKK